MLTIKKASAATGVPEHTLRAWERRYGLFAPTRSPGGYRVYDEAALERIRAMNALVRDGVPPREASVAVLRRILGASGDPGIAHLRPGRCGGPHGRRGRGVAAWLRPPQPRAGGRQEIRVSGRPPGG